MLITVKHDNINMGTSCGRRCLSDASRSSREMPRTPSGSSHCHRLGSLFVVHLCLVVLICFPIVLCDLYVCLRLYCLYWLFICLFWFYCHRLRSSRMHSDSSERQGSVCTPREPRSSDITPRRSSRPLFTSTLNVYFNLEPVVLCL